ncbi:hypothetical protein AAG570_002851 [Ranatra chinensis]|uniref:W2 domain-containing protein n=1 Tax=Ranatra chinensis TaxID=642074 RepID=A0ABD0Y560_9HEMI
MASKHRNMFHKNKTQETTEEAGSDSAETDANIKTNIVKLLHTLYDKELLTEEAILHWNQNPREEETTPGTPAGPSRHALHLRKQIGPFIKWLEEADEQSSSGDDSD